MGGHKDDAEPYQGAPIVSVSIGLEAVYLLGGLTKADPPIAMRLRSGDVLLQGGLSRGYVHGVPRIFANTLPTKLTEAAAQADDAEQLAPFVHWLSTHRLNLNVRQVFEHAGAEHAAATAGCAAGESDGQALPSGKRQRREDEA